MAKRCKRWSSRGGLILAAIGSWMFLTFLCIRQQQDQAVIYDVPELLIVLKRKTAAAGGNRNFDLRLGKFESHSSSTRRDDHRGDQLLELESLDRGNLFPADLADEKPTKANSTNITCDFSHFRTDVCDLRGDVRMTGTTSTVSLVSSDKTTGRKLVARVKPYTRKWETSCMATIGQVSIETTPASPSCDVNHSVPAVIFSTGGYTGNVYHEFNDGLIPLFITSQSFHGEVVFVILELHKWWMMKYHSIISQMSRFPVLDFDHGKKVHCFPRVIVGLRIHDELAIHNTSDEPATMHDFQQLLKASLNSHKTTPLQSLPSDPSTRTAKSKPKLVLLSRKSSRVLLNQNALIRLAKRIGFEVVVLAPNSHSSLFHLHEELHSAEVMVGVHGAALTHFLFLRPGAVLIQIVPLGTEWAARTYYGEPAAKAGLEYWEYKIVAEESSLVRKLGKESTAVAHPEEITSKGWWEMKKVYLQNQDVVLELNRFRVLLQRALKRSRRRVK